MRYPRAVKRAASGRAFPGLIPVVAVVAAVRAQVRGERQRVAGLGVPAEELERAAQAEQRVVVRRRLLDHRLELGGRLLVALRAEQRPAQRLADRRLVRLEVACAGERDCRGME